MAETFNDLFEGNEDVVPVPPPIPMVDASSQSHHSELLDIQKDYIFCSECGQRIKSDSKFCRHCGAKVDDVCSSSNCSTSTNATIRKGSAQDEPIVEHKITSNTLEVKIKHDSSVKKSTIADEIVANLKMIGVALIIWVIYIVGFVFIRSNEAAPLTENCSYFGESCYDPVTITGNWEFSWEKHLAININYISPSKDKYGNHKYNPMSQSNYIYLSDLTPERALEEAKRQAKAKGISDEYFAQLIQEAKAKAKRDRDSFNHRISSIRKNAYENELHSHMLWAAVISLSIMIFGRYFILACKWVSRNKSN